MAGREYNRRSLKKLLTALAAAVTALAVLLALALGLGSLRWRPSFRAGPPRLEAVARGRGPLRAGAAVVPLAPPPPVPVAGFPRLHWMEEGRRDPIAVRALSLQENGCTVVVVSLEILLVPGTLDRAIQRAVGDLKLDRLLVAASHTHAGPGGYWKDAVAERIAAGPYGEAAFAHLVDRTARAVREAVGALEPAAFALGRGEAKDLVRNRRGGAAVDGRLTALRFVGRSGRQIAEVVIFPSHATLLGGENRLLSGDWPGAFMRSATGPVLLFQGAVGDQSPVVEPGTPRTPEAYAGALRARVDQLELGPPDPSPALAVATSSAVLPPPDAGAAPPALKRLVKNVMYRWFPDRALLTALRIGPLTLLAVPGEPVAEVGRRWRELAGGGSEVLALAGEYLGYVETGERMAESAGETVHTYYGPELADRLAGAVDLATRAVRETAAGAGRTP